MSNNDDLFGSVFKGAENALGAARDTSKALGEAVENYNANMNAKRHSETLQNPRLSPDAILQTLGQLNKLYQRTELPQELRDRVHRTMEEAVEKPRLSELFGKKRDEALKKMKDARMPEEIIAKLEQQTFGRTSSSSSASSISGSSRSATSEDTRATEISQESTARVVSGLGKKPDDKQGPLDSPPSLLPSEYQDLEESKKAPTQSTGCSAGIKKAFLSCYSLLSNGLSNFTKLFSKAPESKGYSQVPEGTREAQAPRQRREESKESRESIFASFRNGVSEFMSKNREMDINKVRLSKDGFSSRFDHTRQLGSIAQAMQAVKAGAGKAGKLGISAGTVSVKGMGTIVGGMREVAATGLSGAAYMANLRGRDERSWEEWAKELSASTRGMQGTTVRESLKTVKAAGVFVGAAGAATVRAAPRAIREMTPGPRAARLAAAAAGAGLGAAGSMVKKMGEIRTSAYFPSAFR